MHKCCLEAHLIMSPAISSFSSPAGPKHSWSSVTSDPLSVHHHQFLPQQASICLPSTGILIFSSLTSWISFLWLSSEMPDHLTYLWSQITIEYLPPELNSRYTYFDMIPRSLAPMFPDCHSNTRIDPVRCTLSQWHKSLKLRQVMASITDRKSWKNKNWLPSLKRS